MAAHGCETLESESRTFRRCQSSLSVTQMSQGRHNPLAKSKGVREFDPLKRVGNGHIEVLEDIIAKLFKFPHFGQAVCRRPLCDREGRCVLESSTDSTLNLLFPFLGQSESKAHRISTTAQKIFISLFVIPVLSSKMMGWSVVPSFDSPR